MVKHIQRHLFRCPKYFIACPHCIHAGSKFVIQAFGSYGGTNPTAERCPTPSHLGYRMLVYLFADLTCRLGKKFHVAFFIDEPSLTLLCPDATAVLLACKARTCDRSQFATRLQRLHARLTQCGDLGYACFSMQWWRHDASPRARLSNIIFCARPHVASMYARTCYVTARSSRAPKVGDTQETVLDA